MKRLTPVAVFTLSLCSACESGINLLGEPTVPTGSHDEAAQPATAVSPYTKLVIDANSPNNPWAKQMGDLDGDGFMDMIVGGDGSQAVWYQYPNWGKFTLGASNTQSGSALVDIVGDGYLDVIVGNSWYENPRRSGGSATSAWTRRQAFNGENHDIRTGDLDNDGRVDVVMRGESSTRVNIFYQIDKNSWSHVGPNPGQGLNGLALADLDRDGHLDIIVPGKWLANPGTRGGSWTTFTFGGWDAFGAIEVADMNGDGAPDLVLAVSEAVGKLSWFQNPGNPRASSTWTERVIDTGLDHAHALSVADVDLDGLLDVVTAEYGGAGRLLVYHNNGGAGSWLRQVVGTTGLHNIAVQDYDNDGDVDVMGVKAFGVNPVEVWRNDTRTGPSSPTRVQVFSKTLGFRHASIPDGIRTIRSLGAMNNFLVDATEDSNTYNDANLAKYKAIIFLNPSGNILNSSQQGAMQRFIQGGKGFVGVHNATALLAPELDNWTWYTQLVGTKYASEFNGNMRLQVQSPTLPSTQGFPGIWMFNSEGYNFNPNPKVNGVTVLLNLDESSVSGGTMGADHPLAWFHAYDGGRSWYTELGANSPDYLNRLFRQHLADGILYAIGPRGGGMAPPPNNPPTVATAAAANPNPTAGSTTALSVLGADDGGEAALTYTWTTVGTPPAPVSFSANGTNASKNCTATFTRAGSYSLRATVTDASMQTATSNLTVTVNQTFTSIAVSPGSASVPVNGTQAFTATARDQFAQPLTTQPSFTWTVSGGGTISATGVFTAGSTAGGPFTVTARSGTISGTASVTVTSSAPVAVKINYQLSTAPVPAGYLKDDGSTFADRGNGQTYGWTVSHADYARQRSSHPDPRLDTFIHFKVGGQWEIALPSGSYTVLVSVGDPWYASNHTINVEGVSYWNNVTLGANQFANMTKTVTVSDGRLTVDQGAAPDKATRINYIEIVKN